MKSDRGDTDTAPESPKRNWVSSSKSVPSDGNKSIKLYPFQLIQLLQSLIAKTNQRVVYHPLYSKFNKQNFKGFSHKVGDTIAWWINVDGEERRICCILNRIFAIVARLYLSSPIYLQLWMLKCQFLVRQLDSNAIESHKSLTAVARMQINAATQSQK